MKRVLAFVITLTLLIVFAVSTASASDELKAKAVRKLQKAVVAALSDESGIKRIAVLDIKGDDGTVKRAIISAITAENTLEVVERTDIDKILSEQGFQLKDIIDERTRVKPGKIRPVHGLLVGEGLVLRNTSMSSAVRVHLKLLGVESGEIVFAKDFNSTVSSPWKGISIGFGIAVLVVIIFSISVSSRRRSKISEKLRLDIAAKDGIRKDGVDVRGGISREVDKSLTNLSGARSKLSDNGNSDGAVIIGSAVKELQLLKEYINNATGGSIDMRSKKEFEDMIAADKCTQDSVRAMTISTDKIHELIISGNISGLENEIDILKRDIKNTMNEFKNRGI